MRLLVLPEVFVTPEPHRGIIPQVLKDQAKANEDEKARRTQRDRDKSPSWGDLPDDWDFDQYDHWDVDTNFIFTLPLSTSRAGTWKA